MFDWNGWNRPDHYFGTMGKGGGNVHPRGISGDAAAAANSGGGGALRRPQSSPSGASANLMRRILSPGGSVGLVEASAGGGGASGDDGSGRDGVLDTSVDPAADTASTGIAGGGPANAATGPCRGRGEDAASAASAASAREPAASSRRSVPEHRGRKRSRKSFDGSDFGDDDGEGVASSNNGGGDDDVVAENAGDIDKAYGYVMLDDCPVLIGGTTSNRGDSAVVTGQWIDIKVPGQTYAKERAEKMVKDEPEGATQYPGQACQRSYLILQRLSSPSIHNDGGGLMMDPSSIVRFDGTLRDAKCVPPSPSASASPSASTKNSYYGHEDENRSDAALMMGLILGCQDLGLVKIARCRIALHGVDMDDVKLLRDERSSTHGSSATTSRYRASIAVTLAIDMEAIRSFAPVDKSHSKPPAKKRVRRSSSARSSLQNSRATSELPSSMQLLLSMMRCDWARMNARMETKLLEIERMDDNESESGDGHGRKASVFPQVISLDELYQRITGASTHTTDGDGNDLTRKSAVVQIDDSLDDNIHRPFSNPSLLPDEIIVDHMSKFLPAKSLNNLRCASIRLHRMLRAVVPGLKLRLFKHQVNSLDWMRKREIQGLTEADTLHDHATGLGAEDALVGGDFHRAASGGASVLLSLDDGRNSFHQGATQTIRIDGKSGDILDSNSLSHVGKLRTFARGGLLCDDPGLGKTISVLSLILQTFGLSTKKEASKDDPNTFSSEDDDEIFHSYWRDCLTDDVGRRPELLRIVNDLRGDRESVYFEEPVDPKADGAEDYFDVVKRPLSMAEILAKINIHGYGHDFEGMCSDVQLVFRNAMLYNPPDHHIHKAAQRLSDKFSVLVRTFKDNQTKNAKKAYGSITSKPDSSVAAILAVRANDELVDSLCPSSGNLLIVPNTLLKHWEHQISMHVDFRYVTKKQPLVYRLGKKGKASHAEAEIIRLCRNEKTHFPLLFVDEGTSAPLPPPSFLAMFHIVLTTNQRIQSEWKFGSVEEELKFSSRGSGRQINYRSFYDDIITDTPPPSPLLKVHWLRLVVDEGHVMGRGSSSNTIQFASWITAQRRWAMTGTPTQQTANQNGLRNILGLVKFLKHDFFSARLGGDQVWNGLIARTWNEGKLSSFIRLRMLLSLLMVRHTKADIEEVPEPKYLKSRTRMSIEELKSYNTLVSAAQMNIVTTSMEGKTSGWQDSLLNPRQTKHARRALDNIRLACCGGAHVLPRLEDSLWVETIQYLRERHRLDDVKVTIVDNYLKRATTGDLSSCMSCGLQLQTLFVVPCGCLICTECIDIETTKCPTCEKTFDIDDFQQLQPGLVYEWSLSLKEEKSKRESDEALRRQLNEVHSIAQGGLGLNNDAGDGTGAGGAQPAALVANENGADPINLANNNGAAEREGSPNRILRHRRAKNHVCSFSRIVCDGKCESCREEHFDCNFLLDKNQCTHCYKKAEDCPQTESSKALFVTKKLLNLREKEIVGNRTFQRPLKVIIFSQFRQTLDYVGDRLIRRFGGACVAEYWGSTRNKELEKFVSSPSCFCMLLGKEGSHGLDLSFVTNIILLDEMYDRSLQEQVVARAYRMGATGRVEVEQLIAEDSIEELMERINEGGQLADMSDFRAGGRSTPASTKKKDGDVGSPNSARQPKTSHAKIHHLLKNVRLARGSARAGRIPKVASNLGDDNPKDDGDRKMPAKRESDIESSISRSQARVRFGESTIHSFE